MRRLAAFTVRRRRAVLLAALLFLPLAAAFGGGVATRLTHGGFDDPSSESALVHRELERRFDAGRFDFVVVLGTDRGDVDDPEVADVGLAVTDALREAPGVAGVLSYWADGRLPPLRGEDGRQAIVAARLEGGYDERVERAAELAEELPPVAEPLDIGFSGQAAVAEAASRQAEEDLQQSELLSAPFTFVALVIVFGSVVAALLPLSVAVVTVLGTFLALTLLTGVTDVSVFALNLTTGLGLGLAIDYSLFVVARYREELAAGHAVEPALARAMQTAGRTVAFSAGTVMVSMLALLLFPITYLRSFGYAGLIVVPLAAATAIVVLPALLAVLGPRVDAGRLIRHQRTQRVPGFWGRQAQRVVRTPWPYVVVVTALLLVLALPFRTFESGRIDDRVLPTTNPARQATDDLRQNFTLGESEPLEVLVDAEVSNEQIERLAEDILEVPGVARVDAVTGSYLDDVAVPPNELSASRFDGGPGTWLSVVPSVEPVSLEAEAVVADVRALSTDAVPVLVGGASAELVDTKAAIADTLPWALAVVAGSTLVLLFLMTGSLLVPVKALALNILSLTATFGGMVWVFQEGHFDGVLGFTATGSLDSFTPVLMFCIAFGLSMDYEVFLLSRMKEEYDLERDNEAAIVVGLDRTGRVVTAAALLLSIVFVALSTSDVAVVKLFGVGLMVAVLVDAFLIRATLVPALMTLAGRANWWAPRPLRRFHLRYGIWENEPIAVLDRRVSTADPRPPDEP